MGDAASVRYGPSVFLKAETRKEKVTADMTGRQRGQTAD